MAARHKKSAAPAAAATTRAAGPTPTNPPGSGHPEVSGASRGSATRQAEIETKLEIDPTAKIPSLTKRNRLAAVGITGAADPKSYQLDATYYDTADLDLLRSKMTLRRRTGGPGAGWHLKLPANQGARTEVGLPLSAGEPGDVPAELAGLVRGAARGRQLIPVARLVNDRTVRHLLDEAGNTLIEVADDHVTGTPLLAGGAKPSQWRELEAEIIDGTRDQLAATVDLLTSAGARKAASASKLARALCFQPAGAARNKTAGSIVVAALGRQRDLLITADRGLREGLEGALHDARSAARRIRAMLTVYAPLFEGESVPALRTVLGEFGGTLRRDRDLRVSRRRLLAQLDEEPEEYARIARLRLDDAFGQQLSSANAEIRELIDSADYLQMLRDIDDLQTSPPLSRRGHRAATAELPSLIAADWLRLRELADRALTD